MALTTSVGIKFNTSYTKATALDSLSTPIDNVILDAAINLATGSTADKADLIYHEVLTLDSAGTTELVFNDGTLLDPFGIALTMDILKLLYVHNTATSAGLIIGAGAATQMLLFGDGASDTLLLPPGGKFMWSAPNATGLDVTTNDTLKFENDAVGTESMDFNIIAIGVD